MPGRMRAWRRAGLVDELTAGVLADEVPGPDRKRGIDGSLTEADHLIVLHACRPAGVQREAHPIHARPITIADPHDVRRAVGVDDLEPVRPWRKRHTRNRYRSVEGQVGSAGRVAERAGGRGHEPSDK